jgi:hypothetical protein
MKSTVFASALIATIFALVAGGKSGGKGKSVSILTARKGAAYTSSTSSSSTSSSSSSSSDSSSSSSSDNDCGPQFKVIKKYELWCNYAKVCRKHGMVPAKITSRNIYSAVRAIRKSQHKSAWIKTWNTDPYRGSLVLTVPNKICDGPGSVTVACRGVKKVALCMRKQDDKGDCKEDKCDRYLKGRKSSRHSRKSKKPSSSSSSDTSSSSSSDPSTSSSFTTSTSNTKSSKSSKGRA